jgi:hypothetical protein
MESLQGSYVTLATYPEGMPLRGGDEWVQCVGRILSQFQGHLKGIYSLSIEYLKSIYRGIFIPPARGGL